MARRSLPGRKDILLRRFEVIAGRAEITEALVLSDDTRATALASMMWDPAYRHHSFGKLCEKAGLNIRDLLGQFRQAKLLQSMVVASRYASEVTDEIAKDARSKIVACDSCEGTGRANERWCRACRGEGKKRIPGDSEARRLLFQVAGVLGGRRR